MKQLRDYLWVVLDAREYYKKKTPHLTLVPGFTVDKNDLPEVKRIISDKDFRRKKVRVNTLSVYENLHKPYVVQLKVDYDIHDEITELVEELRPYAKGKVREPTSPHITLFKTTGWWDTIPREKRSRLQEEIVSTAGIRDTEISSVKVSVKS